MQQKLVPTVAVSALLLSGCGGSDSHTSSGPGDGTGNESTAYTVTVNTVTSGEASSTTQSVAEGEGVDIDIALEPGFGVVTSEGCSGSLIEEESRTLYRLPAVTDDCDVDIVVEQKPGTPKVSSEPQVVKIRWESALDVDLMWSTDPNCDWENYASCESAGSQVGIPSGEGAWESNESGLVLGKSYYFILKSEAGYSAPAAGKPLVQSASSSDKAILANEKLYVTAGGTAFTTFVLAQVDAQSGQLSGALPTVDGEVHAVVPDGDGWIIAGNFTAVAGVDRDNIARINHLGVLDKSWNLSVDGEVEYLEVFGDRLALVGAFGKVDGFSRDGVALLNLSTGQLPAVDGYSHNGGNQAWQDVARESEVLYTASHTIASNGMVEGSIISAFDIATGKWLWHLELSDHVMAVSADASGVYFARVYQQHARSLSEIRHIDNSGVLSEWQPELADDSFVFDIGVEGNTLYAFDMPKRNLPIIPKAFSLETAQSVSWDLPANEGTAYFNATEEGLLVFGAFTNGNDEPKGAYNISTDSLVNIPAQGLGSFNDIAIASDSIVLAGYLNWFNVSDQGIQVYQAKTGSFEGWIGTVDASDVNALVEHEGVIYFGLGHGKPIPIEGTDPIEYEHDYTHAMSAEDGASVEWSLETDDSINALEVVGSTLYLAGDFTTVNGKSRRGLAAYDLTNHRLLDWNPALNGNVAALTSIENHLYVGGDFTQVDDQSRDGIAQFDIETRQLTAFDVDGLMLDQIGIQALDVNEHLLVIGGDSGSQEPLYLVNTFDGSIVDIGVNFGGIDSAVHAAMLAGTELYLGGWFYGFGRPIECCRNFVTYDFVSASASDLDLAPNGQVSEMIMDGDVIYLFGYFNVIAGQVRQPVVAIDAETGAIIW
ncbi:hypothetical protein [Gilvimarinus algae]|uniref:Fibronectin type-III domain-containing protein n=1 Tax=Gilvimarinus algae TaxID=3058037 RepID=A0ABT8TGS1_9GAMM|nr:hypothetical protein [Gilvimarinus sp. SDUM040014]MDO3383294.1 hypothetical protein [Gilvimarinus sp. SDUM040014]